MTQLSLAWPRLEALTIATVYISFFMVDEHYITNILKVYNKGEISEILKIKILKLT